MLRELISRERLRGILGEAGFLGGPVERSLRKGGRPVSTSQPLSFPATQTVGAVGVRDDYAEVPLIPGGFCVSWKRISGTKPLTGYCYGRT